VRAAAVVALLLALSTPAQAQTGAAISDVETVHIERIRIVGATVFGADELHAVTAPFENRDLAAEDLEDLRCRLTAYYVERGYINSGAVIRDQPASGGVLDVEIVEGRLSRVEFLGDHHYRDAYLQSLVAPELEHTLNINSLQERMKLLLADGSIRQVNVELAPGEAAGASVLRAAIKDGPRWHVDLAAANDRPVSVGEIGATASAGARNLLGINDAAELSYGLTDGFRNYGASLAVPIVFPDVSLFARYDRNHGAVVESAFRELDITSRETSAEFGARAVLKRSLAASLSLSSSLYFTRTNTYLLGLPFSFTPGVEDGLSKVAATRLAVEGSYRSVDRVLVARSALDVGLTALSATIHAEPELPDSQFVAWKSELQYVEQFRGGASRLVLRAITQLSSSGLLPSERLALGGESVRGYRVNLLVRDQGAIASAEFRQRLLQLPLPFLDSDTGDGAVEGATFIDYGVGADRHASPTSIAGAGVGVLWTPARDASLSLYKGFPLLHTERQGDSLQDRGIHFRVSLGFRA
jgi:hemolysin activation/secretion protein